MMSGPLLLTLQTFLISLIAGNMVSGPLIQLSPTTVAPASSRRKQASGRGTPSNVKSASLTGANVTTAGRPVKQKNRQDIVV